MEDQVITPKYKFDFMEKELKELKEKQWELLKIEANNTIYIQFEKRYHASRFNVPTENNQLRLIIKTGDKIPQEIDDHLSKIKKEVQYDIMDLHSKEMDLQKREYELSKNFVKLYSLPEWIKWLAGVKLNEKS